MIKSVKWLKSNRKGENIVILDASLLTKKSREERIPGAKFFDLKGAFSDRQSIYPNMMPSAGQFQDEARKLGVNSNSVIIVYDNVGVYSSARAWYMFRSMGHKEVYVLDGGLPEWKNSGGEIEKVLPDEVCYGNFVATFSSEFFCTTEDVKAKSDHVVDARSIGRFAGTSPEPRAEIKSGSIAGSSNLPYTEVLQDGKFKGVDELKMIFKEDGPTIFSCGSGVTACILILASEIAGMNNNCCVYDGSWTEWATKNKLFVT